MILLAVVGIYYRALSIKYNTLITGCMIAIIDSGMGNLFSIYNGLKKVYDSPRLITADNISSLRTARVIQEVESNARSLSQNGAWLRHCFSGA